MESANPAESHHTPFSPLRRAFYCVRPAGRTYWEVKVLYSPGKGKS